MAQKEYIKLTPTRQRRRFTFASSSRSSLWLGRDHLLLVDTEGFTESYKRFYIRDIQAIVLRRNARGLVIAIVTGVMFGLFGLTAVIVGDIAAKWTFATLACIVGIPFFLNLFSSPTCTCWLRTAVQTEDLPSVGRVRRARKLLARLRPLVAEAQGQMSVEEISTRMHEIAGEALPSTTPGFGTAPTSTGG